MVRMITTEDFINKLEEMDYGVYLGDYYITISVGIDQVGIVYPRKMYTMSTLNMKITKEVFDLMIQYVSTPVESRGVVNYHEEW